MDGPKAFSFNGKRAMYSILSADFCYFVPNIIGFSEAKTYSLYL